jgi:uncharacterized delta-60 repeat protein
LTLDPLFGDNGIVTSDFGNIEQANSIVLQPDGKIVAAGFGGLGFGRRGILTRYNSDGSLDASFGGGDGLVTTSAGSTLQSVVLQPDGKIIAAGGPGTFFVTRFNSDGTPDVSFGSGSGAVSTPIVGSSGAFTVTVQPDGRILVGGTADSGNPSVDFALVRYNTDGTLDTTFGGGDGIVTTNTAGYPSETIHRLLVRLDGKIVAVGAGGPQGFAAAQYNTDGTLDPSFGSGGIATIDFSGQLQTDAALDGALQADGKLIAVGYAGYQTALARFNIDGTLDSTFGTGGKVTTDVSQFANDEAAHDVVLMPDGKIIVGGYSGRSNGEGEFTLIRYLDNGLVDQSFGLGGFLTTNVPGLSPDDGRSLALQPDGKIVLAGVTGNPANATEADFAMVRYSLNNPPVLASIGDRVVDEEMLLSFTVTASDSNDDPASVLTLSASGLPAGASFDPATGIFNWTPTELQQGSYLLTFTVTDDGSPSLSDSETIAITVREVNDPPTAADDTLADVAEDTASITIPIAGLLANDNAGPANEYGQTLALAAVSSPQGGTVEIVGADVIFISMANYHGLAGFEYAIADNGTTGGALDPLNDIGLVSFNIWEVNDSPTANDDILADIAEGTAFITIPIATLLSNDSVGPANENGQALSLTVVGSAQGGTAQIVGSDVIFAPTVDYSGPASFDYTVQDDGTTNGAPAPLTDAATVRFTIMDGNDAPSIAAEHPIIVVSEGSTATNTGTFSDPDSNNVILSASIGAMTDNGNGTWIWSFDTLDGPDDSQSVTITATDSEGVSSSTTFALIVDNVAADLGTINGPLEPIPVGTVISVSALLVDDGTADLHTATWDWDDGLSSAGVVTENGGTGTVSGSHVYTNAGVYTVVLALSDGDGGVAQTLFQYVVVYDPAAGFVTGGGWIDSPAGADPLNLGLVGKANVGFVSRYQKGATVPTGQTEFQFKLAGLNFHSSQYEWLVVAGAKSKFAGTGSINGSGNYGFMITATDGQISGGGGIDKFRIKIWDKSNGNVVVYDNQMGAALDADPTTELRGGSIVIHKFGNPLLAAGDSTASHHGLLITPAALDVAKEQAIEYWQSQASSSTVREILQTLDIHIADLDGLALALASESNQIWIDRDAAGYGWNSGSSSSDGMDLMSVVVHELGHKLGLDHDVLGETLSPGVRNVPDVKLGSGDVNLDGIFDRNDLMRVFEHSEYEDQVTHNSVWGSGDWNFDHEFTSADLVLAFQLSDYVVDDEPESLVVRRMRFEDEVCLLHEI